MNTLPLVIYGNGQMARMLHEFVRHDFNVAAFTVDASVIGEPTLDGKPVVPGKGTPESDQYYRLKALDAAGNATDLYLDMKSYHLVKSSRMIAMQGQEGESGYTFANYQKQAEGIVVPMSMTNEQGETKFTKVDVNPTIEATLFKP